MLPVWKEGTKSKALVLGLCEAFEVKGVSKGTGTWGGE